MTVYYVDTDGSGASAPYATWATAAQSIDTIIAIGLTGGGDIIYCQGAAADSAAGRATFALSTALDNPTKIIGVKNGTTNAPPVPSDLCTRAAADLFVIVDTTSGITFNGDYHIHGLSLTAGGSGDIELKPLYQGSASECYFKPADGFNIYNGSHSYRVINCEIDLSNSANSHILFKGSGYGSDREVLGGVVTFHASQNGLFHALSGSGFRMVGVDLSGMPAACELHRGGSNGDPFINCHGNVFRNNFTKNKNDQGHNPHGNPNGIGLKNLNGNGGGNGGCGDIDQINADEDGNNQTLVIILEILDKLNTPPVLIDEMLDSDS